MKIKENHKFILWSEAKQTDNGRIIISVQASSRKKAMELIEKHGFKHVARPEWTYRTVLIRYPGPPQVQIMKSKSLNNLKRVYGEIKMAEKQIRKTLITETHEILEVKTVWQEESANELLTTKKWILLHGCIAHRDAGGFQAKPCWLMGRIGKE